MPKDFYQVLGVTKGVSDEEIKSAFRKLAHQHHPDKPGGNAEKFKEINEAYQTLSDQEKRKMYDRFGHAYASAGASGAGFGGFAGFQGASGVDFGNLGDIFGDIFGGGGGRTRTREQRGRDIQMDVALTFAEAAFGAKKDIRLHRSAECGRCAGKGAEPGSRMAECGRCGGEGEISRAQQTMLGVFRTSETCGACAGAGRVPEKKCRDCDGQGVARLARHFSVDIPAGINDGEVLRLSGEGEAAAGGKTGDLYLTMRVKPDARFERRGFDVHGEIEIAFAKAALGGEVTVETVDGAVALDIPAGTQPGAIFRLRAKGIPHLKRTGRGDHFIRVKVAVPKKLTREQRKFLEQWEHTQ